ncbi:MAG: ATP-binding protein [Flavicella sp.]
MLFSDIIGQEHIKSHLKATVDNQRISHAQLFIGKEGSGTLASAIAYAQYLLCAHSDNKESCALKCEKLAHPDLHFAFPVANNNTVKKHAVSNLFLQEWRTFVEEKPYGSLLDWYQEIQIENKQGKIGVDEAEQIVKSLKLKAYEGGYKVMVIWMAEKMNIEAANKLLKLIEEPPENTVFLLVTEDEDKLLNTILSRCQILKFPVLSEKDIADSLIERENSFPTEATKIAIQSDGNYNKALQILKQDSNDLLFEQWFIEWVRSAFKAKGNPAVIQNLVQWSETISKTGRETQKSFLHYCLQFFRQAMLFNFNAKELVFLETKTQGFSLKKFAPFIHSGNIVAIEKEVAEAIYHIERNGNPKIILLDTSIKLTRLLHTKESS